MGTVVGVLVLLLCSSPDAVDSPLASPQSAGQADAQKQAWDILKEGAHGNMDKRANAIQALGLDVGDSAAVKMAEDALEDKEAHVRAAAAKALGALGSTEAVPKLQALVDDKDISVALAVGHALVQLKSEAGYDVYYSLVEGTRKGSTSPITQELDQMKTPGRAILFAFDQGIGFLPYGGYGKEALHAWRKRSTAPTRGAAARELASDPGPAQRPGTRESSFRQKLGCAGGGSRGHRQARGCGAAGERRACNVRQEGHRALFSLCRSPTVESYRARKRQQLTLKAAVGPVMGISLEVGDLAKTRVLIEKNAKRTLAPYIGIYDHSFLLPAELSLWHVD
ncbi:MAG: HEAT repeat domain-containing protein [Candidatus Acidiferrales bacterium]